MTKSKKRKGRYNVDLALASKGGGVAPAPRDLAGFYGNQFDRGRYSRGITLTPPALKRTGLKPGMKVRLDTNAYAVKLVEELEDGRALASLNKLYTRRGRA